MQICHFSYNYFRMKCLKYMGTNKYGLEQKCELNFVCVCVCVCVRIVSGNCCLLVELS